MSQPHAAPRAMWRRKAIIRRSNTDTRRALGGYSRTQNKISCQNDRATLVARRGSRREPPPQFRKTSFPVCFARSRQILPRVYFICFAASGLIAPAIPHAPAWRFVFFLPGGISFFPYTPECFLASPHHARSGAPNIIFRIRHAKFSRALLKADAMSSAAS
jgi:hypothetical protein